MDSISLARSLDSKQNPSIRLSLMANNCFEIETISPIKVAGEDRSATNGK